MKATGSRPADLDGHTGGSPRLWRRWPDAAWAALSVLNIAAVAAWPAGDTIPFHLMAIGFTALYWLRIWPANPMLWSIGIVMITTVTGIGIDVLKDAQQVEEMTEVPLLAAMFAVTVWHANRRITADHQRHLVCEENARLLSAQRRFLQDAGSSAGSTRRSPSRTPSGSAWPSMPCWRTRSGIRPTTTSSRSRYGSAGSARSA